MEWIYNDYCPLDVTLCNLVVLPTDRSSFYLQTLDTKMLVTIWCHVQESFTVTAVRVPDLGQ
jgi:hypothetical protein